MDSMLGMEQVICKTVGALSDVRDAMNKMQSEASEMKGVLCQVVQGSMKTDENMRKMQGEAGTMRLELDQLRAEVAEMKRKQRFQELAVQESRLVFSDAGDVRRRAAREAEFEG